GSVKNDGPKLKVMSRVVRGGPGWAAAPSVGRGPLVSLRFGSHTVRLIGGGRRLQRRLLVRGDAVLLAAHVAVVLHRGLVQLQVAVPGSRGATPTQGGPRPPPLPTP